MVNSSNRPGSIDGDNVQDMGLSGLSRSGDAALQNAGRRRSISVGALRIHFGHVSRGREFDEKCPDCAVRLAQVAAYHRERAERELAVAESKRADEERATTPSFGFGTHKR